MQPIFDPRREILYMWPPWVKHPSLPIELGNNDVLKVLGNGIGKIIGSNLYTKIEKRVIKIYM